MANTTQHLLAAADLASPNLHFQIPSISIKLDRDNYSLWRTTIISALETFDLESFALDPKPPSETLPAVDPTAAPTPNPEFASWKKRDRFVLLWIKSTLSETALAHVARSTSSHQAWTAIEGTYQAQTKAQRLSLKNELQTLPKGDSSMRDYILRKLSIADALAENNAPVSDEDLTNHILNGLDSSYNAFITAFMMKADDLKVENLIGLLYQEEARIARDLARQATVVPPTPAAQEPTPPSAHSMARSGGRYNSNTHQGSSSGQRNSDSRYQDQRRSGSRRPHCQLCNKPGHEAINCWQRTNLTDFPARRPNPRESQRQANTAEYSSPSAIDPSWYFDTGATDHVSPDVRKMTTTDEYSGTDKLQVGNGSNNPPRGR